MTTTDKRDADKVLVLRKRIAARTGPSIWDKEDAEVTP